MVYGVISVNLRPCAVSRKSTRMVSSADAYGSSASSIACSSSVGRGTQKGWALPCRIGRGIQSRSYIPAPSARYCVADRWSDVSPPPGHGRRTGTGRRERPHRVRDTDGRPPPCVARRGNPTRAGPNRSRDPYSDRVPQRRARVERQLGCKRGAPRGDGSGHQTWVRPRSPPSRPMRARPDNDDSSGMFGHAADASPIQRTSRRSWMTSAGRISAT